MTSPSPLACYLPPVAETVHSVFETMLALPLRQMESAFEPSPGSFTAAVYYAGAWKGAFLLECSAEQATDWAARMMPLTPPITLDDARDGLGELTNILAGNIKSLLSPGTALSIPSVVQGTNYSLRICGGNLVDTLNFADALGPFRIALVKVVE